MSLYFGYLLAGTYVFVLLTVVLHKAHKIRRLKRKEIVGQRELLCIYWAWCDHNSCGDVLSCIESTKTLDLLNRQPDVRASRLLLPHITLAIFLILVYQFLRPSGSSGLGDCAQTPNCSNFAIGSILRFEFFEAMRKIKVRLENCSGTLAVSFSEHFVDDL